MEDKISEFVTLFAKKLIEVDNKLSEYKIKHKIDKPIYVKFPCAVWIIPFFSVTEVQALNFFPKTPKEIEKLYEAAYNEALSELSNL